MEQLAMARVLDGSQSDDGVLSPAAWGPTLGAGGINQPCMFDGGLVHSLLSHHDNTRSTNTAIIMSAHHHHLPSSFNSHHRINTTL